MQALWTLEGVLGVVTLMALEIVLTIDNLAFVSAATARMPGSHQARVRQFGIALACALRPLVLLGLLHLLGMTQTLLAVADQRWSVRDLVMILGGLYLLVKATLEIHVTMQTSQDPSAADKAASHLGGVLMQLITINLVFSLDSAVTAVGMAGSVWVMATAMVLAMLVALLAARSISGLLQRHPVIKLLMLAFLMQVGIALLAQGFAVLPPHLYLYFAMLFCFALAALQAWSASRSKQQRLHSRHD